MFRIVGLLFLLLISACSNIQFNERYANAGWEKVIIAPFKGDNKAIADLQFEHLLGTSSVVEMVTPSMTMQLIKEHKLSAEYADAPNKSLLLLANKIGASGVIIGEVKSSNPNGHKNPYANASIYTKLIDVKTGSIVSTSFNEANSMFAGADSLIKSLSSETVDEIEEVFARIVSAE